MNKYDHVVSVIFYLIAYAYMVFTSMFAYAFYLLSILFGARSFSDKFHFFYSDVVQNYEDLGDSL